MTDEEDKNRLLRLRQVMNRTRPRFLHQEHWKLKRFRKAPWRTPRGKRSKMRSKERAKPALVKIGFRGPKAVRGLHPKGVPEIIVHTVQEIEQLEIKEKETVKGTKPKKKRKKEKDKKRYEYIIKIASTVGTRKKIEIVKATQEKNLYVANPVIHRVTVSSSEELESLLSIRDFIKRWFISDKVTDEDREEIVDRAEELQIEVVE
jgi:large subunit ribosomal protein L32e